jgi:hypothetical protein
MSEGLAVRIRHRLRFVESRHDRQLFVECLETLEGAGFVPKVPHPDGTGDPGYVTMATSSDVWTPEAVITWLADREVKLVPWQVQKLSRL